jgi:hypothetical protein
MITGNKGEWSEAYVLLRLLAQGRMYAANEKLEQIDNMYFLILKILREEIQNRKYEYAVDSQDRKIDIYYNGQLIQSHPQEQFCAEADYLYDKIVEGGNRAFAVEHTEDFLKGIGCERLAAPSTDKTDISMQIYDIHTGYSPICGFSIKSEIGNAPTLINATGATNFIYEVEGLSDEQINSINDIQTRTKIRDRMDRIFNEATSVKFIKVNSDTFSNNLMLIDSRMHEIIAASLICHYKDGYTKCSEVINALEETNPLNFPVSGYYNYKFKELLCSAALGMTPATAWDGHDEANGGYIIVTSTGNVLAYHIYNRDYFKEYLVNNTKYERGSTSRHGYASLYKENGKTYLKLNLQIRFI